MLYFGGISCIGVCILLNIMGLKGTRLVVPEAPKNICLKNSTATSLNRPCCEQLRDGTIFSLPKEEWKRASIKERLSGEANLTAQLRRTLLMFKSLSHISGCIFSSMR